MIDERDWEEKEQERRDRDATQHAERDALLGYYERELRFIRRSAAKFGDKYPSVAKSLQLQEEGSQDPHVERLIEAFAMLTARVHKRLDEDFDEINASLLDTLYPHYLRPMPSMCIAQFLANPKSASVPGGLRVERGSSIETMRTIEGVRCRFRTAYPVDLWPLQVRNVSLVSVTKLGHPAPAAARTALRIELEAQSGAKIAALGIDRLRFFLGKDSPEAHMLHELLLRDPQALWVRGRADEAPAVLGAGRIQGVGFGRDEGLLEYPSQSFVGYRLLQEYFAFQPKFLFVDFDLDSRARAIDGETLTLDVLIRESAEELDLDLTPESLKLGCTPVVNLFQKHATPIPLARGAVESKVIADVRAPLAYEVYSVTGVESTAPGSSVRKRYAPLFGRSGGASESHTAVWRSIRRTSLDKDDEGTDVYLSLADRDGENVTLEDETLFVEAVCSNRELPRKLAADDAFQIERRPGVTEIKAVTEFSTPRPPPIGSAARWRLTSHLALNHLSIAGAVGGTPDSAMRSGRQALEALRAILDLYDSVDSDVTRERRNSLVGVRASVLPKRVVRADGGAVVRGLKVDLDFEPNRQYGSGTLLLAAVLERFLGLYTSVNSFTQTVAYAGEPRRMLKQWPARAGEQALL